MAFSLFLHLLNLVNFKTLNILHYREKLKEVHDGIDSNFTHMKGIKLFEEKLIRVCTWEITTPNGKEIVKILCKVKAEIKKATIYEISVEIQLDTNEVREQELQDFVQAKSAALQQADRVLSQYKCRHAQREAEALKLRCLLKESERRSEAAQQQLNMAAKKQQLLQSELEKSRLEINNLEQLNEEQIEAMTEQDQRSAAMQKNLDNLQIEHHSILEMHSMLQRHSETMKQKHDLMTQQLLSLEEEKNNIVKQLKEKDVKVKELSKQLQKAEELLRKKEESYQDLESSKESLQKVAEKMEKAKVKLEQEMSSLELVCRQHEASLNEKDAQIKSLQDELEKQTQLTDVIHEITSGGKFKSSLSSLLNKS